MILRVGHPFRLVSFLFNIGTTVVQEEVRCWQAKVGVLEKQEGSWGQHLKVFSRVPFVCVTSGAW